MVGTFGFLFWSAVVLIPVLIAVSAAGERLQRRRFTWLLRAAVVTGFLVGGLIGWAFVPAEWTASIWTTIDAAGNSVKYGELFEETAEGVLMYFFLAAILGEVVAGLGGLLFVWRLAAPTHTGRLPV